MFVLIEKEISIVDFKILTDVSSMGVVMEPSKYTISLLAFLRRIEKKYFSPVINFYLILCAIGASLSFSKLLGTLSNGNGEAMGRPSNQISLWKPLHCVFEFLQQT